MIDFETLGNGKHACVVQVGACYFGQMHELPDVRTFKANFDAEDAMRNGAEMDASTVYWWLSQSPEAIKSITAEPRLPEREAFERLNDFLKDADEIWSHATFDFVILMEALKRLHIKPKFGYRTSRDIRTLSALTKGKVDRDAFKREGTHHDGLDDAVHQARYVMEMLRALADDEAKEKGT
jgi:hypothetical protein